jgi:predicted DNA-binding transcriptional regulator AlpA
VKRIDGKIYYTIEELVQLIDDLVQENNGFPDLFKNIKSVSGLRDNFRRYGAPKSIRVGTANYYEFDVEELEGDFYDWIEDAVTKSFERRNAKVAKETNRNAGDFIDLKQIIRGKVSRVTFYNYYNKSENPPQKFKIGNRTYFLYREIKEWAKQFPALRAEKI